jgi:thioredoxin 1
MPTLYEFTDENFQTEVLDISHQQPVLVDFTAEWCGPCHMLAPVVAKLNEEWAGAVKVGELDIDAHLHTTTTYDVLSIPTLILFKNGIVAERVMGFNSRERLLARLRPHLG